MAERKALNLVVVGSTPTSGGSFCSVQNFLLKDKRKVISLQTKGEKSGNAGFRSRCLAHAKRALCQLSYAPDDVQWVKQGLYLCVLLAVDSEQNQGPSWFYLTCCLCLISGPSSLVTLFGRRRRARLVTLRLPVTGIAQQAASQAASVSADWPQRRHSGSLAVTRG